MLCENVSDVCVRDIVPLSKVDKVTFLTINRQFGFGIKRHWEKRHISKGDTNGEVKLQLLNVTVKTGVFYSLRV